MRHSIILRVGENLVYQCSPESKPTPDSSGTPVEYNRALPEWERTSKNYLVKKEDEQKFIDYIGFDDFQNGMPVPSKIVEIVAIGGGDTGTKERSYAIYNPDKETNPANKPTASVAKSQPVAQKPSNSFDFELAVDDETGEPKISFKNEFPTDSIEFKMLKSFIIKALKKGVDTGAGSDGVYEFKIKL